MPSRCRSREDKLRRKFVVCKAFLKDLGMERIDIMGSVNHNVPGLGFVGGSGHDEEGSFEVANLPLSGLKRTIPASLEVKYLSGKIGGDGGVYLSVDIEKMIIEEIDNYTKDELLSVAKAAKKHGLTYGGEWVTPELNEMRANRQCRDCKRERCTAYKGAAGQEFERCKIYK